MTVEYIRRQREPEEYPVLGRWENAFLETPLIGADICVDAIRAWLRHRWREEWDQQASSRGSLLYLWCRRYRLHGIQLRIANFLADGKRLLFIRKEAEKWNQGGKTGQNRETADIYLFRPQP